MTAGSRRLRSILAAVTALCVILMTGAILSGRNPLIGSGQTQGEKISMIKAERARLQAHAGAEARIGLLPAFRIASLLTDALDARGDREEGRILDQLPAIRRRGFSDVDALNAALRDAIARPGEGARIAAGSAAERARASLERLAGIDDLPLVLQFTPRFVPPRHAAGDLTLTPRSVAAAAPGGPLRLGGGGRVGEETAGPTVPRYAPTFAASSESDPPVQVELVGLHLSADGGPPPTLAVGKWRGQAAIAPERLRFLVPRDA